MRKTKEKAGVVAIVALVCLLEVLIPVILYMLDLPMWLIAVCSANALIVGIALPYFALQRFRELDEGLEDAVDNY